ncbi:ParB N-terminal domain-containing protein [Acetivibrio mesophilus]|uniref:ParB/Sulfiredoxin domain-containing protein n=1 Tax=Acetivibrio mesophilus TaxID=2487273 RepID=A0A4Q0I1T7_9FIRM|nr:hypothetical protein [Acetivibrio mesophilus]RXE57625.1 hypothetical protein EFD62_16645 [Acetivibrio mesophilus]
MKTFYKNLDELNTEKYRNILQPLEGEAKELLKKSIQDEGIREAIIIDHEGNVVDGNNRVTIAREIGYKSFIVVKELPQGVDPILFILQNQLGRRNLTEEQRRHFIGEYYNRLKGKQGGDRRTKGQGDTLNAAEETAKKFGVSPRTVKRAGKFAAEVDQMPEEERQEVLSGKKKVKQSKPMSKDKLQIEPKVVINPKPIPHYLRHKPAIECYKKDETYNPSHVKNETDEEVIDLFKEILPEYFNSPQALFVVDHGMAYLDSLCMTNFEKFGRKDKQKMVKTMELILKKTTELMEEAKKRA